MLSPSDLALRIDLGYFFMVAMRIFVPTVISSTMMICMLGSPMMSTRMFDAFLWHNGAGSLDDGD
jgi:hypothetical protein